MKAIEELGRQAAEFDSMSVSGLLRFAPDLKSYVQHIQSLFNEKQDGELSDPCRPGVQS
jgi:DNA mismatch repair protein MSH6